MGVELKELLDAGEVTGALLVKGKFSKSELELIRDAFGAGVQVGAARTEALREALQEAIAEIEGSPYQAEAWGWGIAYRIEKWRALTTEPGNPATPSVEGGL